MDGVAEQVERDLEEARAVGLAGGRAERREDRDAGLLRERPDEIGRVDIGVRPCLLTLLAFSAALLPCQENRGSNMPGLFTT